MDEVDNEMIYRKTINDISKKYEVSFEDAYLIYSGKSFGLSPEVQKKIKADSLDPNDQIILKELRELRAIVDSEDRTRPSDPPLGPQIKTQTEQNQSETISDISNCFYKSQSGNKAVWWISFDGSLPIFLSASVNFECIKMLLENPGKVIPNEDLLAKKVRMGSDSSALDSEVAEDFSSSGYDEDPTPRKRGSGTDASSVSLRELFKNKTACEAQLASTGLSAVERAKKEDELLLINQCINREVEDKKNPILKIEKKSLGTSIRRGINEIMISCPKLGQHLKLFMKPVNGMGWCYFPDSKMNWGTHDR